MADYLDMEPDDLRRIAGQHDRAAEEVRRWGQIPHDWLNSFVRNYGTIADPMRAALYDYYDRRHHRAERQARRHERTRDNLFEAARAMEDGDTAGAGTVNDAGGFTEIAPSRGAVPNPPVSPDPEVQNGRGIEPGQFPATSANMSRVAAPSLNRDSAVAPPGENTAPYTTRPVVGSVPEPFLGTAAVHVGIDVPARSDGAVVEPVRGDGPPALSGYADSSSGVHEQMHPSAANSPIAKGSDADAARSGRQPPKPLNPGPLSAVAALSKSKGTGPSLVVGEQADEDLALARALLSSTLLAAADSAPELEWAVALLRTRSGPIVLLTSAEGRGWLPPGLYLPSEVTIPWKWAVGLKRVEQAAARAEDETDPARVLAAFSSVIRVRRIRVSALASSAPISDDLRTVVGENVAIEGQVSAAASQIDFTSPGPGLVDRLALGGPPALLRQAETLPDVKIRAACLELAQVADAYVRSIGPASSGLVSAKRDSRRLQFGEMSTLGPSISMGGVKRFPVAGTANGPVVPTQPRYISAERHSDRGNVSLAQVMSLERRADEVLKFAASEPSRQNFRDALYAFGQITYHPLFSESKSWTPELGHISTSAGRDAPARSVDVGLQNSDYDSHSASTLAKSGLQSGFPGMLTNGERNVR